MGQSDELTLFYRAYLAWVEDGAPESDPFVRGIGLCNNIPGGGRAINEMNRQFRLAGMDEHYPFGEEDYTLRGMGNGSMHLCPLRIQWVKDHIPA